MTKLQQNMTALLVALSLGTTPLWAQETSVPENSQTTQEASAVTQEETENANQPARNVVAIINSSFKINKFFFIFIVNKFPCL